MNATQYTTVAETEHVSRSSRVSRRILEKKSAKKQLVRYPQPSKRNMAAKWGKWENGSAFMFAAHTEEIIIILVVIVIIIINHYYLLILYF